MITALISLALVAIAPAVQDPAAPAASVRVGYHDLNLHTAAGRAELDRRLSRAVRTVCPAPDHRELRQLQAAEACRATAIAAANQQRQVALAASGADTLQTGSSGR